jgi:hypothetical protein
MTYPPMSPSNLPCIYLHRIISQKYAYLIVKSFSSTSSLHYSEEIIDLVRDVTFPRTEVTASSSVEAVKKSCDE